MDSAGDLPKEGLPHSDIRGSTIARISPRLFAACHVLHRLLAPRHPPNALVSLTIQPPIRPHAVPNRATNLPVQNSKHYAYHYKLHFHSQIHLSKIARQGQAHRTRRHLRRFWKHAPLKARWPRNTHGVATACRGSAATCRRAYAPAIGFVTLRGIFPAALPQEKWRQTDSNR